MMSSKVVSRSARAIRAAPRSKVSGQSVRNARFQSTTSTTQNATAAGGNSGLVGGLAGGALVFAAGYGYYHFSGAKTIVNAATQTKGKFDQITKSMKDSVPAEPNELLKWFRTTVTSYATFIPGGKAYVDAAFNDLDTIEQNHRGEVDEIVKKAYSELREATKSGLSVDTAQKTWQILVKYIDQLGELASDSASEILDNHPELKDKVGGSLDQLKSLTKSYGPDAKKELDQTYSQIKDILAGGVGIEAANKIRKVIQEKIEKVKSIGDEAWKKGIEQAQPYLEKSPEIKKLVEENADSLKQGKFSDLFEKIKSGDLKDLQSFVQQAAEKAKDSGLGKNIEKYAKLIPGGQEILPKLQQLQEVAKKHGDEAEKILKDTYKEVADILTKKTQELEKTAEKAKKESS